MTTTKSITRVQIADPLVRHHVIRLQAVAAALQARTFTRAARGAPSAVLADSLAEIQAIEWAVSEVMGRHAKQVDGAPAATGEASKEDSR